MIFLLLYSALGSAKDALLVFTAVPLALVGGVLALWLRGMPMSVSAAMGFIAHENNVAVLAEQLRQTREEVERIAQGAPRHTRCAP